MIKVLTVGHVNQYKAPDIFWQVAKNLLHKYPKMFTFIWAGDGDLLETFQNYTKKNPAIKFLGHRNNLHYYYKTCNLYFQPSRIESHGIAVLGAMKNKMPCVVSNVGGLPESVQNGVTGFVFKVDDVQDAVKQIERFYKNKKLISKIGRNAQDRFLKRFSRSIWEKKLLKIIKSFNN